ncbi:hypothetical protein OG874_03935 [Nocardia sp. NBC_00565]|uniref:hypothetical protein n=1 Tax=Nocardia sp. NBC_00565 TaxID=2975993 RepID=UPI002E8164FA|nr:hypothetical protein [Nocardia sp. NBC_00565]WUC04367.1 hypothetical protein OG874_03935 [Nocardia sp. NBC_00565]
MAFAAGGVVSAGGVAFAAGVVSADGVVRLGAPGAAGVMFAVVSAGVVAPVGGVG